MTQITVKNVSVGDRFMYNGTKHLLAEVVDILECKSLVSGEVIRHVVRAKLVNRFATNTFDVTFTGVLRWKVS